MLTDLRDPENPLDNKVIDRRRVLREEILELMKNPESIAEQDDILLAERYGNYLAFYFHCPVKDRRYQTVSLDGRFKNYFDIPKENLQNLFRYEKNWEEEGYNNHMPVIEMKDGRQIECAILDLDDFEEAERVFIEQGFNQVQRIVVEENATIKE